MAARQPRQALLLLAAAAALLAAATGETPTGLVAAWYAESDGLPMAQLSTPTGYVATYFLEGQVATDTGAQGGTECHQRRQQVLPATMLASKRQRAPPAPLQASMRASHAPLREALVRGDEAAPQAGMQGAWSSVPPGWLRGRRACHRRAGCQRRRQLKAGSQLALPPGLSTRRTSACVRRRVPGLAGHHHAAGQRQRVDQPGVRGRHRRLASGAVDLVRSFAQAAGQAGALRRLRRAESADVRGP